MPDIFGLSLHPAPAMGLSSRDYINRHPGSLASIWVQPMGAAGGRSEREKGAGRKAGFLVPWLPLCKVTQAGCTPHRTSLPLRRGPAQKDSLLPGLNLLSLPWEGWGLRVGWGKRPCCCWYCGSHASRPLLCIWSFWEQVLFGLS